MLYHGGALFGKSIDDQKSLAKTFLVILFCCIYDKPSILYKMLPIANLKSQFVLIKFHCLLIVLKMQVENVKAIM